MGGNKTILSAQKRTCTIEYRVDKYERINV